MSVRAGFRVVGVVVLAFACALGLAATLAGPAAAQKETPSASFVLDRTLAYLDATGEAFTATLTNTGTQPITQLTVVAQSDGFPPPIGPPPPITIVGCPSPPSGWSTTLVTGGCRWTTGSGNALLPGQSRPFTMSTNIAPGTRDRIATFVATLAGGTAVSPAAGRRVDVHAWEITDVIVNTGAAPAVNGSCPAPRRQAPSGTTIGMVVCGVNHMSATATPGTASLGGTFIEAPAGTWTAGPVAPAATPRVLGNWSSVSIDQSAGEHTVTARVQSASDATSPFTTFNGYTSNTPPVAVNNAYNVTEDTPLVVPAPGVLGNDSDADGDAITVSLPIASLPTHGIVVVNANGSFTYTPNANYHGPDSFTYRATDGSATSNVATVSLTVAPAPDAPTDLTVSPSSVAENQAVNTSVGTFSTSDIDLPGDSHTYTLVSGTGAADNGSFNISGNTLRTSAVFDFEADSSYSIRVRTTDSAGLLVEKALTITITNANEQPTDITLTPAVLDEDEPAGTTVGTLDGVDPDVGDTHTFSLVSGTGDTHNASFTIAGDQLQTAAALDNGVYSVRVRAIDAGGLFVAKSFTVTVTDLPEPPTDIAMAGGSVAENQPVLTPVGIFSSADPDVGNTFAYSLVAGIGATDNASFTITGDTLFTNAVFDFEAGATRSIRVRTTDNTGAFYEEAFTITIVDVNEAPTNITVLPSSVAENQPADTAVGTLSATDPDAGDTHTFALVAGDGDADNGSFTISGNSLRTTAVFDFEADSSYSIRVRATDAGGLPFEKQLTITITNSNDAPTDLALAPSSVAENQPSNTVVGTLSTTDPDAGDTHTYTLVSGPGSDDNVNFAISGNQVLTQTPFDFEGVNVWSVRIRTTDAAGLFYEEQVTITITNANEAPTDIALSPSSVAENQPAATAVGTLSTTDPDAGDTFTYTLVSGTGDADNASFQIVGDELQTNAVFDFEADSSYSIRVRSTDAGGLFFEEQFTVTITGANEAPTDLALTPSSVAENQPVATAVGTLTSTDADAGDTHTYTLVAGTGDGDNGSFQIVGDELQTNAVFDFEADSSYSIRVRTTDAGGLLFEEQLTITVTDANDAPVAVDDSYGILPTGIVVPAPGVLTNDTDQDAGDTKTAVLVTGPAHASGTGGVFTFNADGSFSYTPNTGTSETSDSFTYKVTDTALAESNVATVTLSLNQPPVAVDDSGTTNEDTFVDIEVSANDTDAETANAGLTATSIANVTGGTAELQADNRTVRFTPSADLNSTTNPGGFSFTYRANDGTSNSTATATVTITVNAVNDAPVLANIEAGAASYSEQGSGVPVTSTLTVADVDDTNIESGVVNISAGFESGDELVFVNQNGIAGIYNTGTGVLTLSGTATLANYQTALRSIQFRNLTSDNPGVTRTVQFKVNDGTLDSDVASRVVNVTPVNDRPVMTVDAGTLGYTEGAPPVVISPNLTASDVDNANLTFAQVDMSTGGFVLGQDVLGFTGGLPSGVTFSGVHPSGVMQFIGSATAADYQALLRTVTYSNTADAFTSTSRTVIFRVGDGTTASLDKSRAITITPVNDAPALANVEAGALAYTEQAAAVQVTNTLTVVDPDDTNIESGVVSVSAGFVAGDELVFVDQNGITGAYASGTGVLTLTGTSSVANYQAALRSVLFRNLSSDNPGTSRTISFKLNDGSIDSNTVTRTVAITAVNDPPTNTVPGTQSGTEDIAKVFSAGNGNAISVADADAGTVRVQLTAANGTITLATTAGLTINAGANGTLTVTFTGTVAAVNTAMNGMSFLGNAHYHQGHVGDSSLTILTSDEGQTGTGGTLTDTDSVLVNLAAVNDAPVAPVRAITVQAHMSRNDVAGLLAAGITDPDSGDPGYVAAHTLTAVTPTGCTGCNITDVQAAAGTFDINPGPGLSGAHTLSYTVTDNGTPVGPAATSTAAAVNVTIQGPVIWFVDDSAAAGGNGRMSAPFQTIAAADAVDATGHRIFLFSGDYAHGLTLSADEHLIGQGVTGASFDAVFGITPPTGTATRPTVGGTRPTIDNTITFGGNNGALRGANLTPGAGVQGVVASGRTGLVTGEVSITASNAAAVNFTNSAGTASFTEIDATGGANGITWTNASGQNGTLTVTGVGTADCTTAANCTGGAIQNMTGPGVNVSNLTATSSVSLTNLLVQNGTDDGLRFSTVNGVAMTNLLVHNNGDTVNVDHGIEFAGVTGTGSLASSTVSQSKANNLLIDNLSGSLTMNVTANTIKDTVLETNGNDGIHVAGGNTANLTLNVTGANAFSNHDGDHIQVTPNTSATGTYNFTFTGNTFTSTQPVILGGLTLGGGGAAQVTYTVSGNTITNANLQSILATVGVTSPGQSYRTTIENNTIGTAGTAGSGGSAGIGIEAVTQGSITALVRNNTIRNWDNIAGGIYVLANDTCGVNPPGCGLTGGTVNATIKGNTVANPGAGVTHGIFISAGATSDDTNTVCADIGGSVPADRNNVAANEGNGGSDVAIRQRFSTTFRMPGYTGTALGGTLQTDVFNYLNGRNTITTTNAGTPGGTGYLNTVPAGSACPLP